VNVPAAPLVAEERPSGKSRSRRHPRLPKALRAADCHALEQLPNIGPSLAADLRSLGVSHPRDLASCDGYALYRALCDQTGCRQDPCVLDTFIAIVDFMQGAAPRPWWTYTAGRKARFGPL
jgi:hypothetical protein